MKKQYGFTLIELMIASVIGIIIMTGILNLFINTNRNITLSDALSQNQETGRFAMDFLTKNIRKAGYSPDDFTATAAPLLIPNNNITCDIGDEAEACAANNPSDARGDRLSIPFTVISGTTVRSCTGTIINPDAGGPTSAANVFWVSNESDTDRELRCRTYDITNSTWFDSPVSIINNVEAFEFQVGLARFQSEKNTARYVSVDQVTSVALIRAFRIAVLTTSQDELDEDKLQTNVKERTYSLMDADYRSFTDGNLRSIFSNTIELPNQIETVDSADEI